MEKSDKKKDEYYKSPSSITQRSWVRYSFFFLVGIIVGMLVFKLIDNRNANHIISDESVRGTLLNSSSYDKMKSADAIFVDNPVMKTAIDVRYSTQVVEARLDISSLFPVKMMVEFGYNDLQVLNLQNLTANDQSTTLSSSNFVQIENVGDNKYIIQWLNKNRLSHQITFKFYQNDMAIYSNSVTINKE